MSWAAVAVAGATLVGNKLSSDAQEKAADKQAKGIENAQQISLEQAEKARTDALALFEPAFADISTSLQQARNDLISGQVNSQDILNQAFSQASGALQTSQQQAINAILGVAPPDQGLDQTQSPFRGGELVTDDFNKARPQPLPTQPDFMSAAQPTDGSQVASLTGKDGLRPQAKFGTASRLAGGLNDQILEDVPVGPLTEEQLANLNTPGVNAPEQDPLAGVSAPLDPLSGGLRPGEIPSTPNLASAPQGNYGLAGAESAIQDALSAQQGYLTTGAQQALGSVGSGFDQARGDITGQLGAGLSALRSGVATGRGDITSARDAAIGYLDPYESTGRSALDREAALSGALGPEAQAEAFASYNESPGQAYFRDQQERALLRNAAATGQTQSGNVLTALQEQAQGIAAQNYQQDLENLRSLAGRGQQAATTQGGYQQQAGQNLANLAFQGGAAELGARQQAGSALSQLAANRGLTEAQIQQGLGTNLSNIYGQAGYQTSGLRSQAGRDIAGQLSAGGQNQANLINQLGGNLANIDQQTAANLSNLSAQQGQATSGLRTGLAALLANLATGQGTQQANLATQLGGAQAAGVTNTAGNTLNQLLGLYASNPSIFGSASSNNYANAPVGPVQ